jgi:hypothetical protein
MQPAAATVRSVPSFLPHKEPAMFRRLTLRVVVPAMIAAAVGALGASAMPARDVDQRAAVRTPALIDAAAHAETVRAIGARIAGRACS